MPLVVSNRGCNEEAPKQTLATVSKVRSTGFTEQKPDDFMEQGSNETFVQLVRLE